MFRKKQPKVGFRELNHTQIRNILRILFIDDQEVPMAAALRGNGYNVFHKFDITKLPELESDYHLIFCDIKGVGSELAGDDEGVGLIRLIKTQLKVPIVVAYSAEAYKVAGPAETVMRTVADDVIAKDASPEEYLDCINNWGGKFFAPDRCIALAADLLHVDPAALKEELTGKAGWHFEWAKFTSGVGEINRWTRTVMDVIDMLKYVSDG